jgi:hypothetical protein
MKQLDYYLDIESTLNDLYGRGWYTEGKKIEWSLRDTTVDYIMGAYT